MTFVIEPKNTEGCAGMITYSGQMERAKGKGDVHIKPIATPHQSYLLISFQYNNKT